MDVPLSSEIRALQTENLDRLRHVFMDMPDTSPQQESIAQSFYPNEELAETYLEDWVKHRPDIRKRVETAMWEVGKDVFWDSRIDGLIDSMAEDYLLTLHLKTLSMDMAAKTLERAEKLLEGKPREQGYLVPGYQGMLEFAEQREMAQHEAIELVQSKIARFYLVKLQEADFGMTPAVAAKVISSAIQSAIVAYVDTFNTEAKVLPEVGGESPNRKISAIHRYAEKLDQQAATSQTSFPTRP